MLYYIYDDSANILGFKYNGLQYYYQKNYQNDVIGIYDSNYNLVVTYKYDPWGKVISIIDTTTNNIGTINPLRYRSYYYDEETKLYYLNGRYYNPEWCRFINADDYIVISAIVDNLFLYAENNPISNFDASGHLFKKVTKFFSDCYNKGKNLVTNFIDSSKKVVKEIGNKLKKEVSDRLNFYKNHFTIEAGSGTGVSGSAGVAGVTDTTDEFVRYKKGKLSEGFETTQSLSFSHFNFDVGSWDDIKSISFSGISRDYMEISKTDDSLFVGVNINFHLGAGAYIKIGFDLY